MIEEPPAAPQEEVVRLKGPDQKSAPVVRVVPEPVDTRPRIDARLVEPTRILHEGRSLEPDVDSLLSAPLVTESEESAWDRAKEADQPVPWGWFVLVGLLLGGAIIWATLRVKEGTAVVKEVRQVAAQSIEEEQRLDAIALESVRTIEAATIKFCTAETTEQLIQWVRHPDRVGPLIEAYYKDRPIRLGTQVTPKQIQPLPNLGAGDFWISSVEIDGKKHAFVLEANPDGSARVDWESSVCHQPIPWDDYATQRPAGTTMPFRVYLEPDNHFSHEFADESRWLCFRLTAQNADATLFGYARSDSQAAADLTSLLSQSGGRKVPCILNLGLPVGLQSRNGVVIEKLLSPRWIYMESPDAEP